MSMNDFSCSMKSHLCLQIFISVSYALLIVIFCFWELHFFYLYLNYIIDLSLNVSTLIKVGLLGEDNSQYAILVINILMAI